MHATPDLSRAAVIDALIGTEKRLAQLHAAQHRLLATLAQSRTADPLDCTEEEITAALRWSIGPITAGRARAIAFGKNATWRRLLTAPDGTLLHADARTYKPPASVQRLVRLRDRHCTFPGCAMPAARCDLDHIIPFDHHRPEHGGATAPQNLHALCRRHHRLNPAGSWKVAREGEGEVVWSAPTGHRYSTRAEAYAA